jgi:hypothetical protein
MLSDVPTDGNLTGAACEKITPPVISILKALTGSVDVDGIKRVGNSIHGGHAIRLEWEACQSTNFIVRASSLHVYQHCK